MKTFGIKSLSLAKDALNLKGTVVLVSGDRLDEVNNIRGKLEANEVIITVLPADASSDFDRDELKSLIVKALGIVS